MSTISITDVLPNDMLDLIYSNVIDKRALFVVLNKTLPINYLWRLILDTRWYPQYSLDTLKWIRRTIKNPSTRFLKKHYVGRLPSMWKDGTAVFDLYDKNTICKKLCDSFASHDSSYCCYNIRKGIINQKSKLYFSLTSQKATTDYLLDLINSIVPTV
jgi:hypothetical protein